MAGKCRTFRALLLTLAALAASAAPGRAPDRGGATTGIMQAWLVAGAAAQDAKTMLVTPDNFIRAETDTYFRKRANLGPLGQFGHLRLPAPIEYQTVIRMNRDTLYSGAVFDLTVPATVTLPDAGDRYRSMQVLSQDHYTKLVAYRPGRYTLTQELVGTRYAYVIVRTFFDPTDPEDLKAAHKIQDGLQAEQAAAGSFQVPRWDEASLTRVRNALLGLGALSDPGAVLDGGFGDRGEVNPIRHLIATAAGWGGLPRAAAAYSSVTPERNDGTAAYTLTVGDVPADAFWSISVYNERGYFEKNDRGAYSLNSVSAKRNGDGTVTVHFGGDPTQPNYLAIMKGWNYTVRLYRPRKEALDGSWKFPAAQPVVER